MFEIISLVLFASSVAAFLAATYVAGELEERRAEQRRREFQAAMQHMVARC